MIKPVQQDDALLEDVRRARQDADHLHVWWLGQSGFLVQWQRRHLLLDPYLSDSLTKKYAQTDKPHVRMTERVLTPERLDFIDVVTSSHAHTDHLDPETLGPLLRSNPGLRLVVPEANRGFVAERLAIPAAFPLGLDAGRSLRVAGFELHGVPAAHPELEKDDAGRHRFLGYVIRAGPWTLYHSGDTVHYAGMEDWLTPWGIDLALLPINGDRPERRVAGNLDGPEAARLAKAVGARWVSPCHYEMFELNIASPDEFQRTAEEIGQPICVLRCGERWTAKPGS